MLRTKKMNKEKMTRAEGSLLKTYRNQLEYILMRQEFIAPSFLPAISEAFLRDDFNFAEYLSNCLECVLRFIFNLSLCSLTTAMVNVVIWALIRDYVSITLDVIIISF